MVDTPEQTKEMSSLLNDNPLFRDVFRYLIPVLEGVEGWVCPDADVILCVQKLTLSAINKQKSDKANEDELRKLTNKENCEHEMLAVLKKDMRILVDDLEMKKKDTARLCTQLEDCNQKRSMIEDEVDFEYTSKKRELQDQLDQLEREKARKIELKFRNEGCSDHIVNSIENELHDANEKLHETSENLMARDTAIENQRETGKFHFSYKYPTFSLSNHNFCYFPAELAHDKANEKREFFAKLDVVNCGFGMPSINIKEAKMKEIRDCFIEPLFEADFGFDNVDDYFRMMNKPRVKLQKIRNFLKNIGWDLKGTKVFVSRAKVGVQTESIEDERERTLSYFYDQDEIPTPIKERKALVAVETPVEKRDKKLQMISDKYSGKRKRHSDATSYSPPSKVGRLFD